MAYNSSLCAHSISVEPPLTLKMTNESIISNVLDVVIEAATSYTMLHWLCFPFRFKAQMKDELCKRVHYLSLGRNKDIAAFSAESPLCCSRWIWKRCFAAREQNWNVLGNGDIFVTPLWSTTAWLTDLQPEPKPYSGAACCIVDHWWRGWILISVRQSQPLLAIHHCLHISYKPTDRSHVYWYSGVRKASAEFSSSLLQMLIWSGEMGYSDGLYQSSACRKIDPCLTNRYLDPYKWGLSFHSLENKLFKD